MKVLKSLDQWVMHLTSSPGFRKDTFENRKKHVLDNPDIFPQPKEFPCALQVIEENDPWGDGPFTTTTQYIYYYCDDVRAKMELWTCLFQEMVQE